MDTKNKVTLLDFSEQIKASLSCTCDGCGKKLGEGWPQGRNSMTASLAEGPDSNGYETWKQYHYCGEDCLREHLVKRKEKKGK